MSREKQETAVAPEILMVYVFFFPYCFHLLFLRCFLYYPKLGTARPGITFDLFIARSNWRVSDSFSFSGFLPAGEHSLHFPVLDAVETDDCYPPSLREISPRRS